MKFKKILLWLHRWLGIFSGLVVFVVSITGAIFVFEKELFVIFNPGLAKVDATGAPKQPLSILMRNAQEVIGENRPIRVVRIAMSADKAYIFEAQTRKHPEDIKGWFINEEIDYWDRVFVNPYTGQVLGKIDVKQDFFWITRQIHQFLYLKREIGRFIVGSSTLVFIVILISGLILWWPKNKNVAKKRCKIDFRAKWKRLNYDLHQVLGFYVFAVALLIAITGLVWSFDWWENGIYRLLGGSRPDFSIPNPPPQQNKEENSKDPIDVIWEDLSRRRNDHRDIFLSRDVASEKITGILYYNDGSIWAASDLYAYSTRDGQMYRTRLQGEKTLGMKWRNSNYDIHVGKIAGLPGMFVAFFASLICASLPITGFLVWYGRKFKKKKKTRNK